MDEHFIPLATLLRSSGTTAARVRAGDAAASAAPTHAATELAAEPPSDGEAVAPLDVAGAPPEAGAWPSVCRELALLRLAAGEAFERGAVRLLECFGSEILGRELLLAPGDIQELVARALTAFAEHGPVSISVATDGAPCVTAPFPVRAEPSLASGDFVVHVRDGSFESSFAFRMARVVERAVSGRGTP